MKKSTAYLLLGVALSFGVYSITPMGFAAGLFYVDDGGSVGIGNVDPQHKLDVSGAMYSRLVTATSSSINWDEGNVQTLTLSSSPTLVFSNAEAGGEYILILKQDGTGARTVTWPSSVRWVGGIVPTLSASANATDMASFVFEGSFYLGSFSKGFATSAPTVSVEALVVAGGGGGGASIATRGYSGGGGAGGVVYDSAHQVSVQNYSITVGSGGTVPTGTGASNSGGNSIFDSITAVGGGGMDQWNSPAYSGGSGGGGGNNSISGGSGTQGNSGGGTGYGNNGGTGGTYTAQGAGGGGGAGSTGGNGTNGTGGNGGSGYTSSISGSSVMYACGGGGGGESTGGSGGCVSAGDAGNPASAASANSGSGGGAGALTTGAANGGSGGSGIVIIRYPTGSMSASGGTITTSGGDTIHTFTSSGTFAVTAI